MFLFTFNDDDDRSFIFGWLITNGDAFQWIWRIWSMTNRDACRMIGEMLYELMILLDDLLVIDYLLSVECAMLEFWCSWLCDVFSMLDIDVVLLIILDDNKMIIFNNNYNVDARHPGEPMLSPCRRVDDN